MAKLIKNHLILYLLLNLDMLKDVLGDVGWFWHWRRPKTFKACALGRLGRRVALVRLASSGWEVRDL
jgi:hypothetical protein